MSCFRFHLCLIMILMLWLCCCMCVPPTPHPTNREIRVNNRTVPGLCKDLASCPRTLHSCSTDAFRHLDCPSKNRNRKGYSAQCHNHALSREVTYSMFTLTVLHSQLELTEAVIRTGPSASDFQKLWKHVSFLQHVAYPVHCSYTGCSSLPETTVMFTCASLRARFTANNVLFTKARQYTSFWFHGLLLTELRGAEEPVWQAFDILGTGDCQWQTFFFFKELWTWKTAQIMKRSKCFKYKYLKEITIWICVPWKTSISDIWTVHELRKTSLFSDFLNGLFSVISGKVFSTHYLTNLKSSTLEMHGFHSTDAIPLTHTRLKML